MATPWFMERRTGTRSPYGTFSRQLRKRSAAPATNAGGSGVSTDTHRFSRNRAHRERHVEDSLGLVISTLAPPPNRALQLTVAVGAAFGRTSGARS